MSTSRLLSVLVVTACLVSLGAPSAYAWHGPHDSYGFWFERGPRWDRYPRPHSYWREGWDHGRWYHGDYQGRMGWWWIVGDSWYLYPHQIAAVPDPYYKPVIVVQQPAPTTVIVAPSAPATVVTIPSAPANSPTYMDAQGRTCRSYATTIEIDGTPRQAYGMSCLQPDGTWKIVK